MSLQPTMIEHMPTPPTAIPMPTSFEYWGKARPTEQGPDLHLLPYHCLDVAAVGHVYLQRNPALLSWISQRLGSTDTAAVCEWITFWLALHDLGKFSISFQAQRSDLVERLQGAPLQQFGLVGVRHDSLGMQLWLDVIESMARDQAWFGDYQDIFDGIRPWVRAVTGHHGQPPLSQVTRMDGHFRQRDIAAAQDFVAAAKALFLTPRAARVATTQDLAAFERNSRHLSWWIAGLAVLADWIGSNADIFKYIDVPVATLDGYWSTALARAETALLHSGVLPVARQAARSFSQLFPAIKQPSPLQAWAESVVLAQGPQIHLLEDVTGAGKTEAAVALAHRLMESGSADGFFIGLPTMATANAMYGRIAEVYDQLFDGAASLVLAHGRKTLVDDFAASVIETGLDEGDVRQLDESATRRCVRWLADHNKRALLAPAGVGTVDQALLGALQSKHQCLRLLGLTRKVLIVDEVHACDAYMQRTLETLLEFHAYAGGTAILLSATLTTHMKGALVAAFAKGCALPAPALAAMAYPMTTSWAAAAATASETPMATRPDVRRTVRVHYETNRAAVVASIVATLNAGQCVAWIRNTIGDALEAQTELERLVPKERITLFHARFALGDRLDTEGEVLRTFGPESTPAARAGRLLIATQVAEQSLDIDADLLISDLAPIDRLLQRAGRLRRHVRNAQGQRLTAPGTTDQRGDACMWVLGPLWTPQPAANWFKQVFPKSAQVYPHHGQLWRTAEALLKGKLTMPDDARVLIEGVFADEADLPPGLRSNANQAEGKAYGDASQAVLNSVKLKHGYIRQGMEWMADTVAPSRLGEETIDVLLGRWEGDRLLPWRNDKPIRHAWAYSTVRIAKRLISGTAPQATAEREAELQAVRERLPGGGKWVTLLPLELVDGRYVGTALRPTSDGVSNLFHWIYNASSGLLQEATPSKAPSVATPQK